MNVIGIDVQKSLLF